MTPANRRIVLGLALAALAAGACTRKRSLYLEPGQADEDRRRTLKPAPAAATPSVQPPVPQPATSRRVTE